MRLLTRADVLACGGGDITAAIADVRETLRHLRAGTAEMPPEASVPIGPPEAHQARAYALPARVGDRAGVKWTAHAPQGAPIPVHSLTAINDAATGLPLGVVESALLTAIRTAAVSALVLLARPPRRAALLGAGMQAATHLHMLARVFPELERVAVWNRGPERAARMIAAAPLPWPAVVAPGIAAALDGADAVLTCTNAPKPILGADAMQPGRTLVQIGYHEVAFDAIDRAEAVLVDLWGEFRLTSAKSLFQMHRAGRFDPARVTADLAQVALDGWRPAPDAAVYFSSFGLNLFDIALAARVLRVAEARGLGATWEALP